MTNYKELFGNEKCQCGKKGIYIISNGSGKVRGFKCQECHDKEESKQD